MPAEWATASTTSARAQSVAHRPKVAGQALPVNLRATLLELIPPIVGVGPVWGSQEQIAHGIQRHLLVCSCPERLGDLHGAQLAVDPVLDRIRRPAEARRVLSAYARWQAVVGHHV